MWDYNVSEGWYPNFLLSLCFIYSTFILQTAVFLSLTDTLNCRPNLRFNLLPCWYVYFDLLYRWFTFGLQLVNLKMLKIRIISLTLMTFLCLPLGSSILPYIILIDTRSSELFLILTFPLLTFTNLSSNPEEALSVPMPVKSAVRTKTSLCLHCYDRIMIVFLTLNVSLL